MDRITGTCPTCHAPFDFGQHVRNMALGKVERARLWISSPQSVTTRTDTSPDGPVLELLYRERARWPALGSVSFGGLLACVMGLMRIWRPVSALLWPIALGLAGAFALNAYALLVRAFRTTRLCVSRSEIRVERGPLVLRGTTIFQIRADVVAQLYVMHAHTLYALLEDGQRIALATDLDAHAACFMEQAIEEHLGIADRAVVGEDLRG
ncbi:hypothetical protein LZC95_13850 [Pendulispora brunnea]|uniref:DUF304 domain-containing protein n=1 Tax=Pendulispora brunnea TaxID=2905690 RepID=A0ABZ2KNJ7_9BACT